MSQIGFYRDKNDDLNVQGIKISSLAEKYGTPLFIYDAGLMRESYDIFLDAIKEEKFLILPHKEVAEYVKRKGNDRDRWILGMQRLQKQYEDFFASYEKDN
mgnify:CR=1 FL=1